MKAESISFRNYRNLDDAEIKFSDGVNIFTGSNAQGKTNILEAVWLFSSCRSFRGSDDRDFIRHGESFCEVKARFLKNGRSEDSTVRIVQGKHKQFEKNDVKVKASELAGSFYTVLFYPEQLLLVKGAPEQRRRFLDFAVSQIKPKYIEYFAKYNRLITQKNRILREGTSEMLDTLCEWNEQLAKTGAYISFMRQSYLNRIAACTSEVCGEISGGKESISMKFMPSSDEKEDLPETLYEAVKQAERRLDRALNDEIKVGHSLVGAHRDDFSISLNGMPAKTFASQGQQRSCVIAIKTAEAELVKDITDEYPIMLFDDVFSELDSERKKYMINKIKDKQVIVTCCEPIAGLSDGNAGIFTVTDGRITEKCT